MNTVLYDKQDEYDGDDYKEDVLGNTTLTLLI